MFEKLSPEYQVNKRIRSFLEHTATQHGIAAEQTKLLFKTNGSQVAVHLYDGGHHVAVIPLPSILDFFGQEYKEGHEGSVHAYLDRVAVSEQIPLARLNVIICLFKDVPGTYAYDGSVYRKKISTLGLITHFLQHHE